MISSIINRENLTIKVRNYVNNIRKEGEYKDRGRGRKKEGGEVQTYLELESENRLNIYSDIKHHHSFLVSCHPPYIITTFSAFMFVVFLF